MSTPKEIPKECPACGAERVAAIYYGSTGHDPELHEKLYTGELYPGGNEPPGVGDPAWHCNECEHEWGEAATGA